MTSIIVPITINPMPVDNIMMILVTFPSGGLYLSGFSDAEFASETAGGENTTDENNVNALVRRRIIVFSCVSFLSYFISENNSFPTPHTGQTKSSGKSSNSTSGIPFSLQLSSSYTQPHTSQMYFFIFFLLLVYLFLIYFISSNADASCLHIGQMKSGGSSSPSKT